MTPAEKAAWFEEMNARLDRLEDRFREAFEMLEDMIRRAKSAEARLDEQHADN